MFAQVAVRSPSSAFINSSETESPELGQVVGHVRHHGRAWACCLGQLWGGEADFGVPTLVLHTVQPPRAGRRSWTESHRMQVDSFELG